MMRERLHRLAREERGVALVVALGVMLVLGIAIVSVISYTTANQNSTNLNQAEVAAGHSAEAAMQQAYSVLQYAAAGKNTNGMGADNSALLSGDHCVDVTATCPSSTAQDTAGTGSYNGTWTKDSSSNAGLWTITAIGWSHNPAGGDVVAKTLTATVTITTGDTGLPAGSVWNYLFSSAPISNNDCQLNITGQSVVINIPIFVTGNLCFTANNTGAEETKQPIDVTVMGKTVFSGNGTFVGTSSAPITSGVSAGGCTNSVNNSVNNPPSSCSKYPWYVSTTDPVPTSAPAPPTPDFDYWYANAPIGPMGGCTSGSLPSALDTNTTRDNSAPTFDLTPATSYSCTSGNSELSWNAATKVLTIAGDIYIDGSAQVTTVGAVYQGAASLYLSGTFSFSNQNETLCATTAACDFTSGAWSTSTNMLLIIPADMGGTNAAVALNGNNNKLQAGILAPPSATISLGGQNVEFQGPIIGGKYDWGNNVLLWPIPPITDLPPGAPLDPNVSVVVGALVYQ